MTRSRALRIGFSVAISAVFLYFALRDIDWNAALEAFAEAQYLYVIPIVAITVFQLYIRAQRWRVLMRPLGTPPMSSLVAATNIGTMANFLLPLRAGEIIRPVLLSRKEDKPLGGVLATIALERIFDMFTILLLFGLTAAVMPVSDEVGKWGLRLLGLAFVIGFGIAFVRFFSDLALRILDLFLSPVPVKLAGPVRHFFEGFIEALAILDSPKEFLQLIAWSIYLWLVVSCIFGLGMLMFSIDAPLLLGQIAVTVVVAVAVSAPSAPGFIGAFQLGCVISLAIFDVPESKAAAYSLALHVTQFVGVIGAGLYSLAQQGMSLQQVGEVSESDGSLS